MLCCTRTDRTFEGANHFPMTESERLCARADRETGCKAFVVLVKGIYREAGM